MKLRNKKTGEILDSKRQVMSLIVVRSDTTEIDGYSSIAGLNADWEDYTPQESLIKDEKIRKAVRAWAEINYISEIKVDNLPDGTRFKGNQGTIIIEFADYYLNLSEGKTYTIVELCGEEE